MASQLSPAVGIPEPPLEWGGGGDSPITSSILTSLLWTVIVFRSFYSPFNKKEITTSPPRCQNEDKKKGGWLLTAEMSRARRAGVWWPTHSGTPGEQNNGLAQRLPWESEGTHRVAGGSGSAL